MTSGNIFNIIISKVSNCKEVFLVILLKANKNLKINFYYIILPLSLTIYLKIKGNNKLLFNDKKIIL